MKKIMLLAITMIAFLNVSAQKLGTVNLRLILHPIQSITIINNYVDLEYKLDSDYEKGVNITRSRHLLVNSSSDFEIRMKSGTPSTVLSKIKLTATKSFDNKSNITDINTLNLNTVEKLFFKAQRGFKLFYDIKYEGADEYGFLTDVNNTKYDNTTVITYTIMPI